MPTRHGPIVISGGLAQRVGRAGHTWVFLQYLLGLRRLGWDVLFLDRLEPDMCADERGRPCPPEDSTALAYLERSFAAAGLEGSWAVLTGGGRCLGRSRREVVELAQSAPLLLNFMGYCNDEEILAAVERRVFIDLDPGFSQMWERLGLADLFSGHDAFVTVGTRVGSPGCRVPTRGIHWIRTLPPVVLEHWPCVEAPGDAFTTIATWRGDSGPIEYEGRTYGLRLHAFRELLPLPGRSDEEFRIALDIHPLETSDLARLAEEGWIVEDPLAVSGDPAAYRDFIAGSRAELMVAKALYTETRSGWISDRSACYLASGRPVIVSDTGFCATIPPGEGLLPYSTLDEAATGVDRIASDWKRHARAARGLAEAWFDSDRVLRRLIDEVASARLPEQTAEQQPPAVPTHALDPMAVA
jgi:hypothetical protein